MSQRAFARLLEQRRSIRAFTDQPVPGSVVRAMLREARMAPSGANLQPGRFVALTGRPLTMLVRALLRAAAEERPEVSEYSYFPDPMPRHLKRRQVAAGAALYDALGIEKRDTGARVDQFARNFRFFGAPVGIVVTAERSMGKGCFMDLGMAIQTLLLAATARGLSACGIGALATRADVVQEHLGLPPDELVVCGIALGKAAEDHPANRFRTTRLKLDEFAEMWGFDD